jgi:5-enolpyruvylshikimate-3-phosphate synthase
MSIGKVVAFKSIGTKRIDAIVKKAKKFGFTVDVCRYGENPGLSVKEVPDTVNDVLEIYDDDVAPLAGLLLGQKKNASYMVDFHFSHPLRNLAPFFGFDISLKSTAVKETDPLARRIKMMQAKKKSSQSSGQQFQLNITCDSIKNDNTEIVDITLPGDEVLGAVMVTAKSLLPKGSFVINNMPLETWGSPVITFLKKMGCKVSAQETSRTAFGSVGMFSMQKCDLFGRKVECRPVQSYQSYLPSMVVLACFAESQSVFRELEDLRNDDPDGIDLIESFIRIIGARHGEMPDGIVMEGGKNFDGFDITENYPASISGSLAIAGLKCMGDTNIADDLLLQRWPAFREMLAGICEFRADK